MATPEDMDHAQVMRHIADVIESEFPGRQDWRQTPADIAMDSRTQAIIRRVRAMALQAEQRKVTSVHAQRRYQYRVTGQLDGQLVRHAIELPCDFGAMTENERNKYRDAARRRFQEQYPNALIRSGKGIEYSNVVGEMRNG